MHRLSSGLLALTRCVVELDGNTGCSIPDAIAPIVCPSTLMGNPP
jgi:hypothetical protein